MAPGLIYIRVKGNPYSGYRWRRTEKSSKDDILTGYQRNEAMGWYKEVTDPQSQNRAAEQLDRQGIKTYDWAYHSTK